MYVLKNNIFFDILIYKKLLYYTVLQKLLFRSKTAFQHSLFAKIYTMFNAHHVKI